MRFNPSCRNYLHPMLSDYKTVKDVSSEINLSLRGVQTRAAAAGVKGIISLVDGRYRTVFTPEQVENISNYRKASIRCDPYEVQVKIIESFKAIPNNTVSNIAIETGIPFSTVSRIIDNYYKNGSCIIVESKMNL